MANFNTVTDLIKYALFRAGEYTSGALNDSDFYNGSDGGPVLGYINDIIEGLILGSPLGLSNESGQPLPAIDWPWARKHPPGVLHLRSYVSTGTVSITLGSTLATFSTTLTEGSALIGTAVIGSFIIGGPLDLAGWRLRIDNSAFLPRVVSSTVTGGLTTATIDEPWPDTSKTAVSYTLLPLEYDLASDFVRFDGEPTISAYPYSFPVMNIDRMSKSYPIAKAAAGDIRAAALVSPSRIRLSHAPTSLQRVEYTYIYLPDRLTLASTDLLLPPVYRRILPIGAAYYICYDKSDSKAGDLRTEFGALYNAMVSEFNRHQRKMSTGFGQIQTRLGQVQSQVLKTESGLIIP